MRLSVLAPFAHSLGQDPVQETGDERQLQIHIDFHGHDGTQGIHVEEVNVSASVFSMSNPVGAMGHAEIQTVTRKVAPSTSVGDKSGFPESDAICTLALAVWFNFVRFQGAAA